MLFSAVLPYLLQVTLSIELNDSQLYEFERTIPVQLAQPPWNYTLALSKAITVRVHRSQKMLCTINCSNRSIIFIILYIEWAKKTTHGFHCNNFIYSQSIFIFFGTYSTLGNLQLDDA